jgi:hypothetical protein
VEIDYFFVTALRKMRALSLNVRQVGITQAGKMFSPYIMWRKLLKKVIKFSPIAQKRYKNKTPTFSI